MQSHEKWRLGGRGLENEPENGWVYVWMCLVCLKCWFDMHASGSVCVGYVGVEYFEAVHVNDLER